VKHSGVEMTDLGLHSALFISTPINTWQSLSALCHHHGNVYKREKCNAENTLKLQKKTGIKLQKVTKISGTYKINNKIFLKTIIT